MERFKRIMQFQIIITAFLILMCFSNVENKKLRKTRSISSPLRAEVQMNGITGAVNFAPSSVTFSLSGSGLPSGPFDFELREFPVDYQAQKPCSSTGSVNLKASISDLQTPITNLKFSLNGSNSIAGRSINLKAKSGLWEICATIDGYLNTTYARFTTVIGGDVYLRRNPRDIMIISNLYAIDTTNVATSRKLKIYDGSIDEALPTMTERCKSIGNVWDPSGKGDVACTPANPAACMAGDLSGKNGNVQVGFGQAKMTAFTDPFLSANFFGILGKVLAVLDKDDKVLTCSTIRLFKPKKASAAVNYNGIRIKMSMQQTDPMSPTMISVSYTSGGPLSVVQIREFPVFPRLTKSHYKCGDSQLGPVFNPLNTTGSSVDSNSTPDQNPIGDLSKTYRSSFSTLNTRTSFNAINWYMQLFGRNSVVGRSIRIQTANGPYGCAMVQLEGNVLTAIGTFKYPVIGVAIFQQDSNDIWSETTVFIWMSRPDGSVTKNHMWHIHKRPISSDFTADIGRCASASGRYNPYNVYRGEDYTLVCNEDHALRCQLGDLSGKHRTIDIGDGKWYQFTDVLLPLSGPMSIVGRTIDVHYPDGSRLACADIILQHQPSALAHFRGGDGPTGMISMRQMSLYHDTSIDVDLKNLAANAGGYHVHLYPVPYNQPSPCSAANVAGHFDPFGPTKGPINGSPNQYEVGDISGKFGLLTGKSETSEIHKDPSLSLTSMHSVIGRSFVIHRKDGSRWKCANITYPKFESQKIKVIKAMASFAGDIIGNISLSQFVDFDTGFKSVTTVELNLRYSSDPKKKTMNHNWHVHIKQTAFGVTVAERCVSPHYNPFLANVSSKSYSSTCGPSAPLACELGDQSRKLGQYNIGGGKAFFTDIDLPLAGNFSVIGRSFVIHAENSGSARIACADIIPMAESAPHRKLSFPSVKFDKAELHDTVTKALQVRPWQVAVSSINYGINDPKLNCMSTVVYFPDVDGKMLLSKFNALPNENLGKFAPKTCKGSSFHISPMLALLGTLLYSLLTV